MEKWRQNQLAKFNQQHWESHLDALERCKDAIERNNRDEAVRCLVDANRELHLAAKTKLIKGKTKQ